MSVFETHYLGRGRSTATPAVEYADHAAPGTALALGPQGGILYAEDFDAELAPAPISHTAPAATTQPAITPADLARARAEGHAEGMRAASQHAATRQAALQQAALQAIADSLARTEADIARSGRSLAEALARTMLSLAHALLEDAARERAPAQIAGLLDLLLPPLQHLPDITVSVHPFMEESLSGVISGLQERYGGRVHFKADAALGETDARINWPGGSAARLDQEFQAQLRAALVSFAAAGAPAAQQSQPSYVNPEGGEHVG